jgi:PAS domain-containing protein
VQTDEFRTGDALFTVDPDLTVVSWNPAAERLTTESHARRAARPFLASLD